MRNSFKVKVTRLINAHTVNTEGLGTSKLVSRSSMCYQLPRPVIKAYEVWFLHAGRSIPCRPHPAATQLVDNVSRQKHTLHQNN